MARMGEGGAVEEPEGGGAPGKGGGQGVPLYGGGIHREAEARERVERAYVAATMACEERNGMERHRASPNDESAESSA
eukprot:CAMPEP_0181098466 /NCGR_PEP_ID=MMETSP1071-20121207/12142_1 /TAXON_ID=35127 /ORGANISM="Thalassiosira sp., Strain NH16" /LENGTH=77 /DNA_ID=CAMNT_0023181065 /DNA_START=866 /DNA_END=1099 /DNA_ORIENTATION=+